MANEELIAKVKTLYNGMTVLTLNAGVRREHLAFNPDVLARLKPEHVGIIIKWLETTRDTVYAEYKKAWELVSPEVWEGYKLHSLTNLREQLILKSASAAIKERWRLRPAFLDRKYRFESNKRAYNRTCPAPTTRHNFRKKQS